MSKYRRALRVIGDTFRLSPWLTLLLALLIGGAIGSSLLPPLLLEQIIDRLSSGETLSLLWPFAYLGLIAAANLLQSGREVVLTVLGQRMIRNLRHALCAKLERLPAGTFVRQEPGAVVSRFVGDVDTVEELFTSGIISMVSSLLQVIGIFAVLFVKNLGLAILLLVLLPPVYFFTRSVQKRMLKAQKENRIAVSKVSGHVPETIRNIRTIRLLSKERYMRRRYDDYLDESYRAIDKTNFFDAVYSPVILVLNALVTAAVLALSASGQPAIRSFFGMSVGTAVAVINYISQVFGPLEEIGMEIQTIQSAAAGLQRIDEFLGQEERWATARETCFDSDEQAVLVSNLSFAYDENRPVLTDLSFSLNRGSRLTLAGRTGAGKSTLFKLLLGLYRPQVGTIAIRGMAADQIPDSAKRKLFGYVEQTFSLIPGTVADQISLRDPSVTRDMVEEAGRLVGLHETILQLEQGYDTPCRSDLFSQGQWQLLSIARAVAAGPEILLLDEITANLDAGTEQKVLQALQRAAGSRTVLSISHRLYEQEGGRLLEI